MRLTDFTLPLLLVIFTVILLWMMSLYNRLRSFREDLIANWNEIDHQLARKNRLTKELITLGSPVLLFEKNLTSRYIEAQQHYETVFYRIRDLGPLKSPRDFFEKLVHAESELKIASGHFIAALENYPPQPSTQEMHIIETELQAVENRISFVKRSYNDGVTVYNAMQERFPNFFLSSPFGHTLAPLF